MTLRLDHVIVAVHDLEQAVHDYRSLGFTVLPGGVHANGATRNALICFEDGTYIELLALTGSPPTRGVIDFSVLLQNREGLAGFALGTGDLESDLIRLKAQAMPMGSVQPGERRRDDGTVIRWRLALLGGGFAPFFIEDVTPRSLRVPDSAAVTTHTNRVHGVRGVEIVVPSTSMDAALTRYARILGVGPRAPQSPDYHQIDLSTGSIILRQPLRDAEIVLAPDAAEALYAVELSREPGADDLLRFADEKTTHGVRITLYPG